ncbi:cytoplasmic dynein 2 intermediate chain 1-like isoform X2 [Corticium candelabrum]|uniref:cytoplasmic dynein 2 intermediate chain 1-like isoform X2 n=1 Tax=Corticium candelabrum TaxID=121492 RepID=UPI002E2711FD|nr:cytoplasmic dynein 2 intermediate chain 1-like isoform X2 [Corticium candelabrum]
MPSDRKSKGSASREKSKEDTWRPDELSKYTQGSRRDSSVDRRDRSKSQRQDQAATTTTTSHDSRERQNERERKSRGSVTSTSRKAEKSSSEEKTAQGKSTDRKDDVIRREKRDGRKRSEDRETAGRSTKQKDDGARSTRESLRKSMNEEQTVRGRSKDRETKEETRKEQKKEENKGTEGREMTDKRARQRDGEATSMRNERAGKSRDVDGKEKRKDKNSTQSKKEKQTASSTATAAHDTEHTLQASEPNAEQISKLSTTEDIEKSATKEKRSNKSKHSRHAQDKEKRLKQQGSPRLERKSLLQTPDANRLGLLSPDPGLESSSGKDRDKKVKERQQQMMAALAMAEHDRKMEQRQRLLDEMVGDTDSDPDIARLDTKMPMPSTLTSADDKTVSELEEDEYGNDDFETYDEDFEEEAETASESDDEGVDLKEVMQAINNENKHIRSGSHSRQLSATQSTGTTDQSRASPDSPVPSVKTHGRMIFNFVSAAKQEVSQQVARKTKKRGEELLNLIELDFIAVDLLDLAPQSEYEVYMKSYGRANTAQAYVQTNEDNMEQDVQTEEIEEVDKWTQHPPEDLRGCGGVTDTEMEFEALTAASHYSPLTEDSIRLSKFLQQAAQVCSVLLEENIAEVSRAQTLQSKSAYSFSSGFTHLATTASVFAGRHVKSISFSPAQTNLILTTYSAAPSNDRSNDLFSGNGVVCVWNLNEPSMPDKVLTCQSLTTCSCFSPNKASLAFGGTEDGSVVVWDLRESIVMHRTYQLGDREWIVRSPTYSTAGISSPDNHHSPICSVCSITSPYHNLNRHHAFHLKHDDAAGLSFQVASLDECGQLNIWVVVEMTKPDPAGSESDLGLIPGGRVKLVKSTSISLQPPPRLFSYPVTSIRTFHVQFSPDDPNHFYVATNLGCVLHGVRYGGKAVPRAFRTIGDDIVDVTAIDLSPFSSQFLLVGCRDGSLRLHSTQRELPILTWHTFSYGSEIQSLCWSRSRPHVFYVLTNDSTLHIWDLKQSDFAPVASHKSSQGGLVAFGLSNDHASLGTGLPGRQDEMVLAFANGSVESHVINKQFSVCQPDEVMIFTNYLHSCL